MIIEPTLIMTKQTVTHFWKGKAELGDGWATFLGTSGDNSPHQHLVLQLVIALKNNVQINIDDHGDVSSPAILIAANIKHQLQPGDAVMIFFDPQSELGRALSLRCLNGYLLLEDTIRNTLTSETHRRHGLELVQAIAAHLNVPMMQSGSSIAPDRVERLVTELSQRAELPNNLSQFAKEAALSPSRLRHRVAEIVGMPFRPYLRWIRLQRAMKLAAAGATLTQAAHAAGFADAAHLSRTMRRHFGISLSHLHKSLQA